MKPPVTFESDILRLPVAIAHDAAGGKMPLTVYVAADARYDFSGARIPYAQFSSAVAGTSFLTRSDLVVDLSAPLDLDPIAVRRSDVTLQDVVTVIDEVHVPVNKCDWGCACNLTGRRAVPVPLLALAALLVVGRVRRRSRP